MNEFRRVALKTGVTLNVALAGDRRMPAVILLHGFPESHRTWREVAPLLEQEFMLVMPDCRGFAGSDLPQQVEEYKTETLIDDVFALVDALDLKQFTLVGHDWGGAIAWGAALRADPRLERLAIINAPHPVIFQRSLVESKDQRSASQYINAFRAPGFEELVQAKGFDWFFETTFARHTDISKIANSEKQQYIADWSQPGAFSAMLNWYRASKIFVPPPGLTVPLPDFLFKAFPKVQCPTLVIWGMNDAALLPVQLEGLDGLVEDLKIVHLAAVGHFAPWEAAHEVAFALQPFLGRQATANAACR
jgi:pimeloyl-ACP methyl ester carboxylesterase